MDRSIYDDPKKIPHLTKVGLEVIEYAIPISGSHPCWEGEQWVFRPKNFIALRVQYAHDKSIRISFRGHPDEFLRNGIELRDSMGNGAYSWGKLTSSSELDACAVT